MDVSVVVNAFVVAAIGVLLAWTTSRVRGDLLQVRAHLQQVRVELTKRIDAVDGKAEARNDSLEEKLGVRIDGLEERLSRRIERLELGQDSMRSDITRIALAVGAAPRAENG